MWLWAVTLHACCKASINVGLSNVYKEAKNNTINNKQKKKKKNNNGTKKKKK